MLIQWLDAESQALVTDIVQTLTRWDADRLSAILLYGSLARHDERPLTDPEPSDVDILVIFATDDPFAPYAWHVSDALDEAYRRHLNAPREVNVQYATRNLVEWDSLFVANIARDGIVLYGKRPEVLDATTVHLR